MHRPDDVRLSRSPAPPQPQKYLELQLDWDVVRLHGGWSTGPDNIYLMHRLSDVPSEVTAHGKPRRVLEVAAAEAVHSCKLSLRGIECFVVEPSPAMLDRAQARIAEHGARVALVRGIAETLPFADHTFDRVLIDSAIDHLAAPELSVREMTRTLKPDGRLVISFVNYGGASVRLSRLLYRVARRTGLRSRDAHLFWDTPVPLEHTFECTYSLLTSLCQPALQLERAFGVSIGWMVPGWGAFLRRLPERRALAVLRWLDRLAYRQPRLADVVVTVWRPRTMRPAAPARRSSGSGPSGNEPVVRATDVVYRSMAREEAAYWTGIEFGSGFFALMRAGDRQTNEAYTGDPQRTWLDDLIGRGPFRYAAVLGCDEAGYERAWLHKRGSERLDVYELSPGVIRKVRAGLGLGWAERRGPRARARFVRADLNFARLPEDRYDVIWSSGCLHHITNLEHLFAAVERALRPGGLFAFRDYVGERRMQFACQRLARVNAVLSEVPARWRRIDAVQPSLLHKLSPFCGVRSDEILGLAEARFELIHKGLAGALFPLTLAVDLPAIEREAPELAAWLEAAEKTALHEPGARPCGAYAVFRKRA